MPSLRNTRWATGIAGLAPACHTQAHKPQRHACCQTPPLPPGVNYCRNDSSVGRMYLISTSWHLSVQPLPRPCSCERSILALPLYTRRPSHSSCFHRGADAPVIVLFHRAEVGGVKPSVSTCQKTDASKIHPTICTTDVYGSFLASSFSIRPFSSSFLGRHPPVHAQECTISRAGGRGPTRRTSSFSRGREQSCRARRGLRWSLSEGAPPSLARLIPIHTSIRRPGVIPVRLLRALEEAHAPTHGLF